MSIKKLLGFTLTFLASSGFAFHVLELHQAPLDRLNAFLWGQGTMTSNALQKKNTHNTAWEQITRHQQYFRGIPIIGAEVTISQHLLTKSFPKVNGLLYEDMDLDVNPKLNEQEVISLAEKAWLESHTAMNIQAHEAKLQIRAFNEGLVLVYLVTFKTQTDIGSPAWPYYIIDANTGSVVMHWDNIQHLEEKGPGGNEKVQQYWYGKEDLPSLIVKQKDKNCIMDVPKVRLVNLKFAWDWDGSQLKAYQYPCGKSHEDEINGAFSPINDAYYLGHIIVDMYKDWYGLHALQDKHGKAKQLIMRVHFGKQFDNAFWDGTSMTFGDGKYFYPLVALDVAGHEVTHGFTQQHAALEYHDQSGALNESMSDMAGQSARAYLLNKTPQLYNKMHVAKDKITWGIGESIVRSENKALRYMNKPSSDGRSADCLHKSIAKKHGVNCEIHYAKVVADAKKVSSIPSRQQSYIVHMASGVFNKAFYLLAQELGIRKAYELMVLANIKYWTPTTDFNKGACGVIYAARDLAVDKKLAPIVFGQVGIDVSPCKA